MGMELANWLDYGIIALIGVSVLMGIIRGFVREAMSLLTWVIAIAIAIIYCEPVAALFTSISMEGVRLLLAFVLLVLATLIVGGILGYLLSRVINVTGFGITDRIIGVLFGLARGAVAVALLVMVIEPSSFSKDQLWQESKLIPRFQPVSYWMKERLPEDLLKRFEFE